MHRQYKAVFEKKKKKKKKKKKTATIWNIFAKLLKGGFWQILWTETSRAIQKSCAAHDIYIF